MANKNQELFSEVEQAQVELRESIEHSRRLVERSDALIQQMKDQSPEPGGDSCDAPEAPPAVKPPR